VEEAIRDIFLFFLISIFTPYLSLRQLALGLHIFLSGLLDCTLFALLWANGFFEMANSGLVILLQWAAYGCSWRPSESQQGSGRS
jgi:hypothetical protein